MKRPHLFALIAVAAVNVVIIAQESIDQKMIAAIKAEAQRSSEAPAMFRTLTGVFGPRLTGDDPGTGATDGVYMQENAAAKRIVDAWLESLRDVGAHRNVIEGIGSTDHVPFDEIGIPAFTVIKDFRNYDTRTRHTNADMPDGVSADDLRQSATVLTGLVWHAAMRDEPMPRKANSSR
jgi:hypothetical protein